MKIEDILIGDSKIRVETEDDCYEYERDGDFVDVNIRTPEKIVEEIEKRGFTVVCDSPKSIKRYIHDEPTPYEYEEVAEKLGLNKQDDIVEKIANVGYEIELEIEVTEDGEAYMTHVDGIELKEKKKLY